MNFKMFLNSIMLLPKATSLAPAFFTVPTNGIEDSRYRPGAGRDLLHSWRLHSAFFFLIKHSALIVLCVGKVAS